MYRDFEQKLRVNTKPSKKMPKTHKIHIDSFSGIASDLKGKRRTAQNVLNCLKVHPRLSTWDMSEHAWLRKCIKELENANIIKSVDAEYPWHEWKIV